MQRLRICYMLAGILALSACKDQPTANQISVNGTLESDEAVEEANTRATHLAERAAQLNAEAAQASGARRQALRNEAEIDLSDAVSVQRRGETDAVNIATATEDKIKDLDRR